MGNLGYFNKIHNRSANNIKSGDWFYINSSAIPIKVKMKSRINVTIGVKLGIYTSKDFKQAMNTNFDYLLLRQATIITERRIYYNQENMIEVK